jgi:hypothetical protein
MFEGLSNGGGELTVVAKYLILLLKTFIAFGVKLRRFINASRVK